MITGIWSDATDVNLFRNTLVSITWSLISGVTMMWSMKPPSFVRQYPSKLFHLLSAELESSGAPLPEDGDVLSVQEPLYVFVQGEVRRPGRIALAKGLTLLQAIAMSEGLTDWASKREVRILRKSGEKNEEIRVNLNKVEAREMPDPPLVSNDIVLVKRRIL